MRRLIARPWPVIVAVAGLAAALMAALLAPHIAVSFGWVIRGAQALLSAHPFDVYLRHPSIQMGPLSLLLGTPFALIHPQALRIVIVAVVLTSTGLLVVREIERLLPSGDARARRRWFLTGLVVVAVWTEVAVRNGHLDDALVMVLSVLALRLLRSDHGVLAAVAFGLAVDAKPWALPFAALLLLGGRRRLPVVLLAFAVTVVVAWTPFLLVPGTISALAGFRIPIAPDSTLALLGLSGGTPAWCRPAQVLLGTALSVAAIRRSRWSAVLVLVVATRILLDPATRLYYDSGLVVAAAVCDLTAALPITTAIAVVGVLGSSTLTADPTAAGVVRTAALVAILAVGLLTPQRDGGRTAPVLLGGRGAFPPRKRRVEQQLSGRPPTLGA